MPKLEVVGFGFHNQQDLALYKNEGKEKGMFKLKKPLMVATIFEDKAVIPLLEALAISINKNILMKAYRENDNGDMDFCTEMYGKSKVEWGGF